MVQWLRLRNPNAGGPGSVPGQGTKSHIYHNEKILCAGTKICCRQINKELLATEDFCKQNSGGGKYCVMVRL